MPFKFFTIPIPDNGRAEAELNGFLRSHKILMVDRRWVEQGSACFWSFCIDYLDSNAPNAPDFKNGGQRGKVDYKEVLSPEEFAVFAKLRDVRKEIAQAESVAAYVIFTNEQLAQMVKLPAVGSVIGRGQRVLGPPGVSSKGERFGRHFLTGWPEFLRIPLRQM